MPQAPRSPSDPTHRPAADDLLAAVDEAMLVRLVPEPVRIRALDLFLLGRVEHRLVSGPRLLAEVRGTRGIYRTVVHVLRGPDGPDAAGQCECPRRAAGGLCKHAVALLYAWIHEPGTFASVDQRLQHLEGRPRGELLEVIRRFVEEEPALLEELDAIVPPLATIQDEGGAGTDLAVPAAPDGTGARPGSPGPAAGPRRVDLGAWLLQLERRGDPEADTLHQWADALQDLAVAARTPESARSSRQASPAAVEPALAGSSPRGDGAAPAPAPRGTPEAAAEPLAGPGDAAGTSPAGGGEGAGGAPDLTAGSRGPALHQALLLAVTGLLWRQAGLVLAARVRDEGAAARLLLRRWEGAARLLTRLAALPLAPGSWGNRGPALRARCLAAIPATAELLGPQALLAASRFFLETGRYGTALRLARRALDRAAEPGQVVAARDALAAVWLARGCPERAVPYLAANFAADPGSDRLEALEEAARAAGQWEAVAPAVERHLEERGDPAALVGFLLRKGDWDRLAAVVERPQVRAALPVRLLVAAADALRRPAPRVAAALYREAMARPDAGNPRDLRARWEALQHRLAREGGMGRPEPPPPGP